MDNTHYAPYIDQSLLDFAHMDNYDLEVIICQSLQDYCAQHGIESECYANTLKFSDRVIEIHPKILQLNSQSVLLNFAIESPKWSKSIIENSAGMGINTAQALANALESFASACLEGLLYMLSRQSCYEICHSSFLGQDYKWHVYLSDLVSIGEAPDIEEAQYYWDEIKELLLERLGNQKFCYVKLFASKSFGSVHCECRIDNVVSHDITNVLMEMTKQWPTEKFASHKMFFYLQQEEEEPTDDASTAKTEDTGYQEAGELHFRVNVALGLFGQCSCNHDFERLPSMLRQAIGNHQVALELYYFLPEICAQRVFTDIKFSDHILINVGDQEEYRLTMHQLSQYTAISRVIDRIMTDSPERDIVEAYKVCATFSSSCNVINNVLNENPQAQLTDLEALTVAYFTPPGFKIR